MFFYLATPYSKYPHGLDVAFQHAAEQAGLFVRNGHAVYSPIVHTHPIAIAAGINPLDHELWLDFDRPMMLAAIGLVVCRMEGWTDSVGIRFEIQAFEKMQKPVYYMTPGCLPGRFQRRMPPIKSPINDLLP
jgi:hypothetical protein